MTERPGGSETRAVRPTGGGPGRLAAFTAFRALIPVFALIGLAAAERKDLDVERIGGLLTAQVALTIATQALAMRRRSAAHIAVWLGLLGDLVAITALCSMTGGAGGPLTFLYTVEAVAAGILLEARLGLRVLGLSMAAIIGLDFAASQQWIKAPAGGVQVLLTVAVLWTTAGGALVFSMLNERELRRHAAELQTIRRVTLDIEDSLSIGEVMGDLCRGAVEAFGFSAAAALVRSGDGLSYAGGHNVTGRSDALIPLRGPLAQALSSGHAVVVPAARAREETSLHEVFGPRGYVALPLGEHGLLVATRSGRGHRGAVVRAREVDALEGLAHHAALALANARLHEHVSAMARTDPLTGLPNHGEFQRALAAELGRLERFAALRGPEHHASLIMADIDHFKSFNDAFGHQAGDEVLRGVADAIRTSVRSFDVPARYGGEEFAVVLPETDFAGAMAVAERVRTAVAAWTGGPRQVTVSVGVSCAPSNGTASAEMIAAADRALYASKKAGRDRVTGAAPGRGASAAVVSIAEVKSRRKQRGERPAAAESRRAPVRSSRPKRRIPRA